MSKATAAKQFVLVSLDNTDDPTNIKRKIRRYFTGNKLSHIFSSNVEEMKEFLDKVHNRQSPQSEDDVYSNSLVDCEDRPAASLLSNQEMLEKWAREMFSSDSSEINIFIGTPAATTDNDDDESSGGNSPRYNNMDDDIEPKKKVPKIVSVNSFDSEADSKRDDALEVLQMCALCDKNVDVGKNRNTKVKRQAVHVMEKHFRPIFEGVRVMQRYECNRCHRFIPVYKSPCDHITEFHFKETKETEFSDLWSKDQLIEFNRNLTKCFGRTLPVPRGRRFRNGLAIVIPPKPSYRIKQDDNVVQINTVAVEPGTEKPRPENETHETNEKVAGAEKTEVQKSAEPQDEDSDVIVVDEIRRVNRDHDYYDEYDEDENMEDDELLRRRRYYDEDDVYDDYY